MSIREIAAGLHFGEGPRWHQGKLWFSDFYDHAVKTVDERGVVETKLGVPGQPSGLGWLPDGRMLVVSMLDRAVLRMEYGHLVVHADLSHVADFHCNDMVVDSAGRAYVGNFGFDVHEATRAGTFRDALDRHAGTNLARVDPDGTVAVAASGMMFPNGMAITPDGRTLIVAETMGRRLTAFDIDAFGNLLNRRLWASLGRRSPDGICLDEQGAVWVADAAAAECVRVAEGGRELEVVPTGQTCFACMLGGRDGRTLFMLTAAASHPDRAGVQRTGSVLAIDVEHPHAGLP